METIKTREEMEYDSRVLCFEFDDYNGMYSLESREYGMYNFHTKNIVVVFDESDFAKLEHKIVLAKRSGRIVGVKLAPQLREKFYNHFMKEI